MIRYITTRDNSNVQAIIVIDVDSAFWAINKMTKIAKTIPIINLAIVPPLYDSWYGPR